MAISVRDRKLLWTRSGNVCAFPACNQNLVLESDADDVIVGEEAHIVARNPDGPRGNAEFYMTEIDTYSNLILLCPTHHRIVDAQPEVFTSDALHAMKYAHERVVREAGQFVRGFEVALDIDCPGRASAFWRYGDSTVVACSYGSPPILTGRGHWKGSGIQFVHSRSGYKSEYLLNSSEAQPDIEYWFTEAEMHVIQSTFLYDESRFTPLVEHVFNVSSLPAKESTIILVEGDTRYIGDVEQFIEHILNADDSIETSPSLGKLFKAGIADPDLVLKYLPRLKESHHYDGAEAMVIKDMQKDLELIKRAKSAL